MAFSHLYNEQEYLLQSLYVLLHVPSESIPQANGDESHIHR